MKNGPRTLAEQMQGLQPALAETAGKTVLDLGCAEGLIGMEFAKAGAGQVLGIEYNGALVEIGHAELQQAGPLPMEIRLADLSALIEADERPQWDIVLALAILHKLQDPAAGVRYCCQSAASLIVVRLPIGSTGHLRCKYRPHATCDLREEMPRNGFRRERKEKGPRGEWVHYYRRG